MYYKWRLRYGRRLVERFHRFYYHTEHTWEINRYLGYPVMQFPSDLWVYQSILYRCMPACIVQTGVSGGGSLLFLANTLDLIQAPPNALVIGIDIQMRPSVRRLDHPRIRLLEGSSVDPAIIAQVETLLDGAQGLVSLDSNHSYAHVLQELQLYQRFVSSRCYMVVEDTNVNGHPVFRQHGPGPFEAVQEFLRHAPDFAHDTTVWQANLFSFHQHGWLVRLR
jgi:cephalosporin hydroxylase